MDLILLRHGETPNNSKKIYNDYDTPLSENGIFQIEKAADKLNKFIVDYAIVSPLLRTKQTFSIIQKYQNYPFSYWDDVVEVDAGLAKGKSFDQIQREYKKEVDAYLNDYIKIPLPEGESIYEAYKRADGVLKKLRKMDRSVLMVTHGGFISVILSCILKDVMQYKRFSVDNGSFTLVNLGEYDRIRYINRI